MFVTRSTFRLASHTKFMGRQQTLGKFFEMPRSAKPAPAQQSSLAEMWGGKKKRKDDVVKKEETPPFTEVKELKAEEPPAPASTSTKRKESLSPKRGGE
ncbi:hypothetical protein BV22DRAFT_18391 [Leucogyrophana mollusca]|uniref:Uncharacterized protein n=1 Tax=Leucogyrophana mollusca TaxID=85980 RepID=A0ACB8C1M9_9AGAM|nr:hypothetical protein BV22DRAFT_18391 [Leucogyrophana mollusca]